MPKHPTRPSVSERGDDGLTFLTQGPDRTVQSADAELGNLVRFLMGLCIEKSWQRMIEKLSPPIVSDHQFGKCGEVCSPGSECADHTIQAEAFGGRLGPDQVPDGNR